MSATEVIAGRMPHWVERAEAVAFMDSLPADCVDLICCSPPYVLARTYSEGGVDYGIARPTEEWVEWMLTVCEAARRVCKGLCAFVVEGQTSDYCYDGAPFLLLADLRRRGFNTRKPPIYRRSGIPGSGGPDWLRNDFEPIVCFSRPGRLPWSDPTACGAPPKYAPGGEMSNRTVSGARANQSRWGGSGKRTARGQDGQLRGQNSPTEMGRKKGGATRGYSDGDSANGASYDAPAIANPGNVVSQKTYTAEEVALLLEQAGCGASEVIDCVVGGGRMGSPLASRNEAPFPEQLPEFLVRSFCPPGGIVLDCFGGSGTTSAVAFRWGRRTISCDLRQSQVELMRKRLSAETPMMFEATQRNCATATPEPTLFD